MIKQIDIFVENKYKLSKAAIRETASILIKKTGISIDSLHLSFIKNEQLRKINEKHLNSYYDTDIITFNYSDKALTIDGEILISIDEAIKNAQRYKCDVDNELKRLIIHGILHLIGFNDYEKKDKKNMREMEDNLLEHLKTNKIKIYHD